LSRLLADTSAQRFSRLSIIHHAEGVYTPTHVLYGTRNATLHLQFVLVFIIDDIKSNIKVWLNDSPLHTKTEDDLSASLFFQAMSEVWIEAARRRMRVVCNHGAVLWKADHKVWRTRKRRRQCTCRRTVPTCRLGTECRGSILDAKRDTQLLEACGPSSSSTGESV
jgi:hypothetical protein